MPPPAASDPAAESTRGPGTTPAARAPAPDAAAASPDTATAPQPLTQGAALASITTKDQTLGDIASPLATKLAAAGKTSVDFESQFADVGVLRHEAIVAFLDGGAARSATQTVASPDPIAVQKFADVDSEQHLSDPGLVDKFYLNLVTEMKKPSFNDRTRSYSALKAAAPPAEFAFKGNQITPDRITPYSSRNQSVDRLYDINTVTAEIDAAIEHPLLAARARPDTIATKKADVATRKKAYRHLIAARDPKTTIDLTQPISPYGTWYKPGEITVPAGSNETQYARMMQLGALQPEWYPNGTVVLNIERTLTAGARDIRKPTAFDGLMSVLWVSRNIGENDYGVTGGGIGEFLEKGVLFSEVVTAQAIIPNDDFLADIQRVVSQAKAAAPGSTATEEVARGNGAATSILNTSPEVGGMYNNILSTTAGEKQNPSAAPAAPGAVQPTSASTPATPAGALAPAGSARGGTERSSHAAGPPPPAWQSQVVATMPSENVRRDDPGHTYHILADGRAVATSQPVLLVPEVAQQLARQVPARPAPGTVGASNQNVTQQAGATAAGGAGSFNMNAVTPATHQVEGMGPAGAQPMNADRSTALTTNAANPVFEREALDFERSLGSKAAIDGVPHAATMVSKVKQYMDARVALTAGGDTTLAKAELEKLIIMCGTAKTKTFVAGAVGADIEPLNKVIAGATETVANLATFDGARQLAAQAAGAANLREMMTFVYNFGSAILNGDHIKAAGVDEGVKAKMDQFAVAGGLDPVVMGRLAKASMWATSPTAPVVRGGPTTPAAALDATDAMNNQLGTRGERQKITNGPAGTDLSTRTAAGLDQAVQPSPREASTMGIDPADNTALVTWSEGTRKWCMNELDPWVQAMRQMSLPLAAGPSGTTNMLMNTNEVLQATGGEGARLACLGYLLPIHAHTAVEVLTAAATHGVGFTAGPNMYTDIKPYSAEDLRLSCGLTPPGVDGKKRFPHEKAPEPAAAAVAQAGA